MSFNFPNSPTEGQIFSPAGGPTYVYKAPVWTVPSFGTIQPATAQDRNRIVNGAMQISQEGGADSNSTSIHPADQFALYYAGTGMTCTAGRFGTGTNQKYIRLYNNAAKTVLVSGDVAQFYQYVEGIRIADFMWGSANALPVVLRFTATCTSAVTFGVAVNNNPVTHSYVKNYSLAANTVTEVVMPIPGATLGTWNSDTSVGLAVVFSFAAHSSLTAPAEGWNVGSFRGVTGMSNGMTTGSTSFTLRNVGLYLDPLATGIAPPWVTPDEAEELRACQRYYDTLTVTFSGNCTTSNTYYARANYRVVPRTTPSATGANVGAISFPATVGTLSPSAATGFAENRTANATASGAFTTNVVLNARM